MIVAALLVVAVLQLVAIWLAWRRRGGEADRLPALIRDELDRSRREAAQAASLQREELDRRLEGMRDGVTRAMGELRLELGSQLSAHAAGVDKQVEGVRGLLDQKLEAVRDGVEGALAAHRTELAAQLRAQADSVDARLEAVRRSLDSRLAALQQGSEDKLEGVRASVARSLGEYREEFSALFRSQADAADRRLQALQQSSEQKLDEMRRTVDEKLQSTLEKRLGESFSQVAERLEKVHAGLGEMRTLAGNVLDLNRVLSNVKDRGMFGEVQLQSLLDQVLAPGQYAVNAAVSADNPGQRVEFAIRLPNRDRPGETVLLPIDAKFPLEDYRRLLAAQRQGDDPAREAAARDLAATLAAEARRIHDKYVQPPATTDFAFMFLPTEGLYAEVASRPELMDRLRELRIIPAGPVNLYALLDLVALVHRFMAVQENASRVWDLLGAVKSEFAKFGDIVGSVRKKIEAASREFDSVDRRTRAINRHLRDVQELPAAAATEMLPLEARLQEP